MSGKRRAPTRRTVRHLQQKNVSRDRRDGQRLAERYDAQANFPEPEPQGRYQP